MKLFISYSRDDKDWVFELERALNDAHYVWLDRRVVPAQDWWDTILDNLEISDAIIYIMSPKSVESIYCQAELTYALALGKPILPIMLKPCDYPTELNRRRIQYKIKTETMSLSETALIIERGLSSIQVGLIQGRYPSNTATRPDEPTPEKKPEQAAEVFMMAEEAVRENNISLAEKLFQQVVSADPYHWGMAAAERISQIHSDRIRDRDYHKVLQLASDLGKIRGARAAAKMFSQKYPNYDPEGILPAFLDAMSNVRVDAPLTPRVLKAGDRWIDAKGVPMVYVPTGKFFMGNIDENPYDEEILHHEQTIKSPFWLDLTPVTNDSFAQFVHEGGYLTPEWWTKPGWQWVEETRKYAPREYPDVSSRPNQPRVGVTWFEAYAYCRWRGGRLPTELEWEWAARGYDNWIYPWGNEFILDYVSCRKNNGMKTTPSGDGIRMEGASWVGALDMSGNVWEWCNSLYRPYPFKDNDGRENNNYFTSSRVLRGGSFASDISLLGSATRLSLNPTHAYGNVGLRCVRSF